MGMLTLASGFHTKGSVLNHEKSDEYDREFNHYIEQNQLPISSASAMKAGDVTWHYGCTIHNAPGNNSNVMREVMTILYLADGAKVIKPGNSYQENDYKTWPNSTPVGQLIYSELNLSVL